MSDPTKPSLQSQISITSMVWNFAMLFSGIALLLFLISTDTGRRLIDRVTSDSSTASIVQSIAELDTMSAYLDTAIEAERQKCSVPVFISRPFQSTADSPKLEVTLVLKVQYVRWQIEVVLYLARLNQDDKGRRPGDTRPRPRGLSGDSPSGLSFGTAQPTT